MPSSLRQFLADSIGLSQGQLRAVGQGAPAAKALKPSDHREVAVFGIIRIDVPRTFYVRAATDFPTSLRMPSRLEVGLFSDPPRKADIAALSIPHADVHDLAQCRPGSCDLKLPVEAIAALRQRVAAAPPGAADSIVNAYFRDRALQYVTGYRARGNAALVVYDDQQSAVSAAQVFDAILSRSSYMYDYAPSLEAYLKDYPNARPADLSEVLFWSEDDLPGLKPTLTITHEVIYSPPELSGKTLIASKLLYADHYLDGALEVTVVVDQARGQPPQPDGIYLAVLNRLHFDHLPSGWPLNVRGRVIAKLRDRMASVLRETKRQSEEAYAHLVPPSADR
jgi:hypothetical protein